MANWWDEDFELLPTQMPNDTTIERGANQLIKRYGKGAPNVARYGRSTEEKLGDVSHIVKLFQEYVATPIPSHTGLYCSVFAVARN